MRANPRLLVHLARRTLGAQATRVPASGLIMARRFVNSDSFAADALKAQGETVTAAPKVEAQAPDADLFDKTTPKVDKLLEELLSLNVVELNQLMNAFQRRLGLSDAQLGVGMVAAPSGSGAAAAAEEPAKVKDTFDLKLVGFDDKSKIKVIKEVRTITGLGLKEAKEAVESLPKVLKKEVKKDEADKLKEVLEAAGAKVELS